jgi:hypothetical protein
LGEQPVDLYGGAVGVTTGSMVAGYACLSGRRARSAASWSAMWLVSVLGFSAGAEGGPAWAGAEMVRR